MHFDKLFQSRFIKSGLFGGRDVTLTIKAIHAEELDGEDDKKESKVVINFVERPKEWLVNKTNALCLRKMFGAETSKWIGKRVTLFAEPFYDNLAKEQTTAIRVRGSPDIPQDMEVLIRLMKRKPQKRALKKTSTDTSARPLERPSRSKVTR
jgi:hypothetical protein